MKFKKQKTHLISIFMMLSFFSSGAFAEFPSAQLWSYEQVNQTKKNNLQASDAVSACNLGAQITGYTKVYTSVLENGIKYFCRWTLPDGGPRLTDNFVEKTGGSCPANSAVSSGGCECNSSLIERHNYSSGYYCKSTTGSQDSVVIGIVAAGAGITVASLTGLAGGLAACLATIVCAAALAVFGLGALLAGSGLTLDDSGSLPSETGETPLIVRFKPQGSDPLPNEVFLEPGGAVVSPSNSAVNPDNTRTHDNGNGKPPTIIDEDNSVISHSRTNPDGSVTTTTIKNTSNGAEVLSVNSSNYGVAPNGDEVRQIHTSKGAISSASVSSDVLETSVSYQSAGVSYASPPAGTVVTGGGNGSGSGSGSGSGDGTGNTNGCGDLACESTLQQVRINTNVTNELLAGQGTDSQSAADELDGKIGDVFDNKLAEYMQTFHDLEVSEKINSALSSLIPLSPFEKIKNNSSSCELPFTIFGTQYVLTMCAALPFIHPALTFVFGWFFITYLLNLAFERPQGGA